MKLTIANVSTKISAADFEAAVKAIERQVTEHFQPEWGISATLTPAAIALGVKKAPVQKGADAVIYLGDSSSDPARGVKSAYGYHSANNKKIPYGFVYLDICDESKESWSCTLSHEVLELLGDPHASVTISGPTPKGVTGKVYYDLEVCDPTQGDQYVIDEVVVSNFVGKSYFGLAGGSGKTNHLNLKLAPFKVRPGGYLQYEKGSKAHQIWGKDVTKAQKQAKAKMKDVRRNGRRAAQLKAAR